MVCRVRIAFGARQQDLEIFTRRCVSAEFGAKESSGWVGEKMDEA